jgi:hypothetical protein
MVEGRPAGAVVSRARRTIMCCATPNGLEFVVTRLRRGFSPATARKWLTGTNAHLGNRQPIDLIAHNRIAEVIAALGQADLDSYA